MMRIDIATLFPEVFAPYLATSIIGKAQENGIVEIRTWNIRDFAVDKHKTVDDTPYGGGAGMVMKVEPIHRCLQAISTAFDEAQGSSQPTTTRTVVLSARGAQFTHKKAQELSKVDHLILICGRYEGIDQRVADHLADEELSIGPYVLAGGELPALVVAEAAIRLIPGVLGNPDSLTDESHSAPTRYKLNATSYIEAPQYTKPETYNGWAVPDVLLSGNHAAIEAWRKHA